MNTWAVAREVAYFVAVLLLLLVVQWVATFTTTNPGRFAMRLWFVAAYVVVRSGIYWTAVWRRRA